MVRHGGMRGCAVTLPVSLPLGGAIALVLAAAIAAFVGGVFLGAELQAGRAAQSERIDLRRQVDALDAAAVELRRRGLAVAQDFRTAQIRFEVTAEGLSNDFASLDDVFIARMADLESLLAAHPEWGDCSIGADGVHAWHAAAAGAELSDAAAAIGPGGAGTAVPDHAAAADGRQPAGADTQLRPGRRPVPPMPLPDMAIGGGAGDL